MKTVYVWVADYNQDYKELPKDAKPKVFVDLFFTSPETFKKVLGWGEESAEKELLKLVPVYVGDAFDDLDYIPDNY